MKDISWNGPKITDGIKVILYFTALEREVTKAGKSCKESYFLLYLSLKLALLNLFGPNLGYLWIIKRSIEQFSW